MGDDCINQFFRPHLWMITRRFRAWDLGYSFVGRAAVLLGCAVPWPCIPHFLSCFPMGAQLQSTHLSPDFAAIRHTHYGTGRRDPPAT